MFSYENLLLFFMIFFGFLGLMYFFILALLDCLALFKFKQLEATVINCNISKKQTSEENKKYQYTLNIKYSYDYNGYQYSSSRLNSFNSITNSILKLEKIVEDIKISNKTIKVFVCPYYPAYAVIFPMYFLNEKILLQFFIALLGFACGIFFTYVSG